jgi:putative ABC transport system substrate-binding protein
MNCVHRAFTFLAFVLLGSVNAMMPMICDAQQARNIPKIGVVLAGMNEARFTEAPFGRAFLQGMREHGYERGRDFNLEIRATQGRLERYAEFNTELARIPVDVLMAVTCGEPLEAARRATQTIPIVVATDDMVEAGVVRSYRRPGAMSPGSRS